MDVPRSAVSPASVRDEEPVLTGAPVLRPPLAQSLPARPAQPAPAPPAAAPSAPQPAEDWAVCCSGGGIRSATFCLGGMQSLDEGGLLRRARWILGVSGGSYIAASRALVAHGLHTASRPGAPPAYARSTPEEQNLRNNTHYLAPDAKTVLVAVLSLVLGATVTCVLALAPLFALGHAWGWLLRSRGVLSWPGGTASASVTGWTWWLAPAGAAAITLVLFVYWWATLGSGCPGRGTRRARAVGWAAAAAAALALLMLVVPPLIAWLYRSTGALGTIVRFFGLGGPGHWSPAVLAGLIAAVVAVARSGQKQLARLKLPAGAPGAPAGALSQAAAWARGKLMPWLASLVVLAAGGFATLMWIGGAARAGYSPGQLVPVLAAVAVMVGTRAMADINRTSLHDFYRWRLADAYAVTRDAVEAGGEELSAAAARTRLSELTDPGAPALVIATTANVNAQRAVPPGRGGFCLAFAPDKVTLRGDPLAGEPDIEVDTADYEHLLGHTRFTLFDVVAISGAAFSPLMGAATRSAYRILLTFTNMRLGVWLPHPAVVRRARDYLAKPARAAERDQDSWWARQTALLLLWYVARHPFGHGDPQARQRREDRLWAHVLKLREDSAAGPGGPRRALARLRAALCWRVMQPTLGMLWAEAAGHTSYRATWVNVTDGGHYDNLALVEALRRGAKNIVVLDASGDSAGTWFTLGGAMALARADAGVEISLDPTTMVRGGAPGTAPGLRSGEVRRPWAHGTFARPDGTGRGLPPAGNIWVCKLGWWSEAPWDIRAYAASHPRYPCDTTLQQLYDGAEFEAYHELGACAVTAAAAQGRLPLLLPERG